VIVLSILTTTKPRMKVFHDCKIIYPKFTNFCIFHGSKNMNDNTYEDKLFSEGKKPFEVVIELGIREAQVNKFFRESWKIKNLNELYEIYSQIRDYSNHPSSYRIITFSNSSLVAYDDVCNMDLQRWEFLWKILATIGVANLLLFFIIVFVLVIDNSLMIWILIGIESACYLGVLIVRRHIHQLLR
jgi:hypothetical protein